MVLDHIIAHSITGRYMPQSNRPVIDHPVIPLLGNRFYVLSFSPAADGTRAEDWYAIDNRGVRPVCSCRAYTPATGCKHCAEVQRQEPALIAQVDALLAADLAERKAARLAREAARQAGRAA
jgi:hypothetical protein